MAADISTTPLSDAEMEQLVEFLARYVNTELDQFEHWRVESAYGPAFIDISRHASHDAHWAIWPLPASVGKES
ncbi:hypothetical protein [Plantactinospora sp. ZYX-F-223]|uniref:hypothetical protein n=1 Tax=Plantactinospora sp. ZYX-F-223 TaxID=3144103 RepID=UPI0031FC7420